MEKYNFNEELKKDEKNMSSGTSAFYQINEGNENVVRILTGGKSFVAYFQGKGKRPAIAYGYDEGDPRRAGQEDGEFKPSYRYALYVLDRSDGEIRLAEFPYSVQKAIGALQQNPDYEFDSVPMPYDVRITYNKEESPANMYVVNATPNRDELTDEQKKALKEKLEKYPIEDYIQKKKDAQKEADKEAGLWVSEEQRKKSAKDWADDVNAKAPKMEKEKLEKVEYPEDDINPEDIPF